jgi:hypothetical protein
MSFSDEEQTPDTLKPGKVAGAYSITVRILLYMCLADLATPQ